MLGGATANLADRVLLGSVRDFIVVFVIATRVSAITGVAPLKPGHRGTGGLESVTRIYDWPGLHIVSGKGKAVATTFKLNILSAAGTLLLLSGLLTMIVLRVGPGRGLRALRATPLVGGRPDNYWADGACVGSGAPRCRSAGSKTPTRGCGFRPRPYLENSLRRGGSSVEVKIGVREVPREVVVESGETPEDVTKLVTVDGENLVSGGNSGVVRR